MKVGDKIYYGTEKKQHMDEIEKDNNGYYGRYDGNNATTEHFPTIDALVRSYVNNKFWLYVSIETDGVIKELKNIEKILLTEGRVIVEENCYGEAYYSDSEGADEITIKIIQYKGDLYYVKIVTPEIFTPTHKNYHECTKSLGQEKITIKRLN